jgi:hypothetical protein
MKYLWILLLSFSLLGCGSLAKKPDAIISEKIIHIDPRALIPCSDLTTIPDNDKSFETLIDSVVRNAEIYLDCRNKQNTSIKLLKEFANIKDKP